MNEIIAISQRCSFVENEKELSIVISSAADKSKTKTVGIILVLWIIGGFLIGMNYFRMEDHQTKVFILVWMAFWAYFSYVIGKAFFWQWSGKEILKIQNGKMFYKRVFGSRGCVLDYELVKIRNMRKFGEKTPAWIKRIGGDYWNVDCDSILFEYEEKEIAFGFRLSEKETSRIINLLKNHLSKN